MDKYLLTNGMIEDEERTGWIISCPNCQKDIRYTILNIQPGEDVFLYCNKSSDFVLRDEDLYLAHKIARKNNENVIDGLIKIYDDLEHKLPECPCGGSFKRWSNVKCPFCLYEFPYNNGVKNEAFRMMEGNIIWIEGAIAYRGNNRPSNRLVKVDLSLADHKG